MTSEIMEVIVDHISRLAFIEHVELSEHNQIIIRFKGVIGSFTLELSGSKLVRPPGMACSWQVDLASPNALDELDNKLKFCSHTECYRTKTSPTPCEFNKSRRV